MLVDNKVQCYIINSQAENLLYNKTPEADNSEREERKTDCVKGFL